MRSMAVLPIVVLAASLISVAEGRSVVVAQMSTQAGAITVERVAGGLDHPWGMAFLPDGRLLVTERAGDLRILGTDGGLSAPVAGVPAVSARGQGGLLDVALDPEFETSRLVYLSFAEPGDGGASTAVGRGRLRNGRIAGFEVIFRQQPKAAGRNHFGGRIVFSPQGNLFLTLGERFEFDPAQDLSDTLGALVRVHRDGSIPADNPFIGQADAVDAIWTFGHRNVQGAAIDPRTGLLWVAEMGPYGGDELNLIEAGGNYGWPVVSWGRHYDGTDIPDPPTHPRFVAPVRHWTPVISPSGMTFYTGDLLPQWRDSLLIAGLSARGIVRLEIDGDKVTHEERIPLDTRIRDVEQAPDGSVYVLTDQADGSVWRLVPAPR